MEQSVTERANAVLLEDREAAYEDTEHARRWAKLWKQIACEMRGRATVAELGHSFLAEQTRDIANQLDIAQHALASEHLRAEIAERDRSNLQAALRLVQEWLMGVGATVEMDGPTATIRNLRAERAEKRIRELEAESIERARLSGTTIDAMGAWADRALRAEQVAVLLIDNLDNGTTIGPAIDAARELIDSLGVGIEE